MKNVSSTYCLGSISSLGQYKKQWMTKRNTQILKISSRMIDVLFFLQKKFKKDDQNSQDKLVF